MKIKLGVIFGGKSVEHEVSIISAVQAMQSMNENKYDIIPIYITKEGEFYTGKALMNMENYSDMPSLLRFLTNVVIYRKDDQVVLQKKNGLFKGVVNTLDIVFPIVHGANVEDGTLQGFLDMLSIPYVGSSLYGSVAGQQKVFMKQIFEASKLPITKYVWFYDSEFLDDKNSIIEKIEKIGYPIIVKPATLGSSIGISKASNKDELIIAIEDAMQYDKIIVAEEMLEDIIEVNCSVLGNYENQETSEIEEVYSNNDFLTFEDKYVGEGSKGGKKALKSSNKGMINTERKIPADISDELRKEVRHLSKDVFKVLNLSGVCRIDFLINKKDNKVYVNEANTIPGSLSFYLWSPIGKTYQTLLDDMINVAVKDYNKKGKKITSFKSNILTGLGVKGLKGSKKLR